MGHQKFFPSERQSAEFTRKGFLPGVGHLVFVEVVFGAARVAALTAVEGLGVRVYQHVLLQVGGLAERGAAVRAQEGLQTRVFQPVAVVARAGRAFVVTVRALGIDLGEDFYFYTLLPGYLIDFYSLSKRFVRTFNI